ncbi:hypothetical protein BJX70DRAFT_402055 [Aspergillus crustosus]
MDDLHTEDKGLSEPQTGATLGCQDEKALMRKVDWHIFPVMFVAYMLQYLDKTALGNTALFGIQESLASQVKYAKGAC